MEKISRLGETKSVEESHSSMRRAQTVACAKLSSKTKGYVKGKETRVTNSRSTGIMFVGIPPPRGEAVGY